MSKNATSSNNAQSKAKNNAQNKAQNNMESKATSKASNSKNCMDMADDMKSKNAQDSNGAY